MRHQMYDVIHANTIAIAKPMVPSHMPPAPNNFMSPIPIGGYFCFFVKRSNKKPTISPKQYPLAPPTIESDTVTGQGKKFVINNPANKNGNK